MRFLCESDFALLLIGSTGETYRNKHLLNQKNGIVSFPHFWAGFKDFKGSVANRALSSLHGGSLEITLTVPLTFLIRHIVCSMYLTVNKIFSLNLYYLYLQVKMFGDLRNVPPPRDILDLNWKLRFIWSTVPTPRKTRDGKTYSTQNYFSKGYSLLLKGVTRV